MKFQLYLFFKCNPYYIAQPRHKQFATIKQRKCFHLLSAELPGLSAALMLP